MKKYEVMISSMTPQERSTPELLATGPSRRRRIARGSGRKELDVTNMVAQFSAMRSRMRDMSKMMAMSGGRGGLRLPAAPGKAPRIGHLAASVVFVLVCRPYNAPRCPRLPPAARHCVCQVCLPWWFSTSCLTDTHLWHAGLPAMNDKDMMSAMLEGQGARKVSRGKVRRKKGQSKGMRELARL